MAVTPNKAFETNRADEVAECWEGVSKTLYRALWEKIVPAMKPLPNIEDNGPHDVIGIECLANHWHLLDEAEQTELNALAAKRDQEFAEWREEFDRKYPSKGDQ